MPSGMFIEGTFSQIGRSTETELDGLRRQLGTGIDPAYDYSKMIVHLAPKKVKDHEAEVPVTTGPLAELEKALSEAAEMEALRDRHGDLESDRPETPARIRERRRVRSSPCFTSMSRNERHKCTIEKQRHAPDVGKYRPKHDLVTQRVEMWNMSPVQKVPNRIKVAELAQLKADGANIVEHFKSHNSLDEKDAHPKDNEHVRMRSSCPNFTTSCWSKKSRGKSSPRDQFLAQGIGTQRDDVSRKIVYNESRSKGVETGEVLQQDLRCSHLPRRPHWDFSKGKPRASPSTHSFFKPGQYENQNLDAVRDARDNRVGVDWSVSMGRAASLSRMARQDESRWCGGFVPDRSLSRSTTKISTRRSCPTLDFSEEKQQARRAIKAVVYHNAEDPHVDELVHQRNMTLDLTSAVKPVKPRVVKVLDMERGLRRETASDGLRAMGQDAAARASRFARDIVSVETLPVEEVDSGQCRTQFGPVPQMSTMYGRGDKGVWATPSARQQEAEATFMREHRDGDQKPCITDLSEFSADIMAMRKVRPMGDAVQACFE
eukprot:CAMPEP_0204322032 /NCGR_PEP_ID=MMETSP0469-20131031/8471_1 /ASSEMBLY_ACC=CAM_ASM_000384 /TAXON_ID=2969 /ORGANISM="Oxyrrhis marina" /LENGTH=544 /DNA_ID=CAMNT_0051303355 /DNA_START=19 /DNA_END=1653 /DNA_ORIENTATION=-